MCYQSTPFCCHHYCTDFMSYKLVASFFLIAQIDCRFTCCSSQEIMREQTQRETRNVHVEIFNRILKKKRKRFLSKDNGLFRSYFIEFFIGFFEKKLGDIRSFRRRRHVTTVDPEGRFLKMCHSFLLPFTITDCKVSRHPKNMLVVRYCSPYRTLECVS